ncbi:hypothetical protein CLU79DRAFT_731770 [Phycomyces nitens]|nr:hypothetical protein CLU79DRAFT_731770 [Phycomyces nitens]
MPTRGKLLEISMLLCIAISQCHGLPEVPPESFSEEVTTVNRTITYSIFVAFLLVYWAHGMTIRASSDTLLYSNLSYKFLLTIFPTFGFIVIADPLASISDGDTILGIDIFKKPLEEYNKTITEDTNSNYYHKEANDYSGPNTDAIILDIDIELEENPMKNNIDKIRQQIHRKNDWLVDYGKRTQEFDTNNHDNAPYLAAILQSLDPDKARKLKHCLHNSSLFIGFDMVDETLLKSLKCIKTEEMNIIGPGAVYKYQAVVPPKAVRYLPTTMLDQLSDASSIDQYPFKEIFYTLAQLLYTIIAYSDINIDRWLKLVYLVYMVMTFLHTLSLLLLHSQTSAFSIQYTEDFKNSMPSDSSLLLGLDTGLDQEFGHTANDLEEKDEPINHFYDGISHKDKLVHRMIQELNTYKGTIENSTSDEMGGLIFLLIFGLLAMPFLLGIWADYSSHSPVKWVVLTWSLSSVLPFAILFTESDNIGYLVWGACSLISFACIIGATVMGYSSIKE